MNKKIWAILILFLTINSYLFGEESDHDEHSEHDKHNEHEGESKAIGQGKAIIEISEEHGLKLSPEAIKTLGITFMRVESHEFLIDKTTLITYKRLKGVYRYKEGFFKLFPVILKREVKGQYLVKVKDVEVGDQIVISATGPLRVADLYSTDKAEYSHSH